MVHNRRKNLKFKMIKHPGVEILLKAGNLTNRLKFCSKAEKALCHIYKQSYSRKEGF